MRLDRFLTNANVGSRKIVKELIRKKKVLVNGQLCTKDDTKIDENEDIVEVEGVQIKYQKYVYYMMNKPSGVITATKDDQQDTVLDLIHEDIRKDLFPIGRLDKDTKGLLILTNDGKLAHDLTSPKHHCDKKYYVRCQDKITPEMIQTLENRIDLKEESFQPGKVEVLGENELYLTIQEGKFHQVKRMVHHAKNEVIYLKRVQVGTLILDENLKEGEYRPLSMDEIKYLGANYIKIK